MAAPSIPTLENITDHRDAVNRENAQHSTGPRTDDGKHRVRFNALKHGAYSKLLILPDEDSDCFLAEREGLIARHQPQTEAETALVDALHETGWRLSRMVAIETNLLTTATQEQFEHAEERFGPLDPIALRAVAQALAFAEKAGIFAQIGRQESRLRRLYDAQLKQLQQLISERQPERQPVPVSRPEPARGFVPPPTPAGMPHFTGPLAEIKRKQWIRQQATRAGLK